MIIKIIKSQDIPVDRSVAATRCSNPEHKSDPFKFYAVWPDGYLIISIFGHLEQWKFPHKYEIFAKGGSQFCQILNSYSRKGHSLLKLCLSGKILAKSGHTDSMGKITSVIVLWKEQ